MILKPLSIMQVIVFTILVIILESISFNDIVNSISPFWLLIFWSYVVINYNIKSVYILSLLFGVILDIISGGLVGENALTLIITSLFIVNFKKQIKIANSATIFVFIVFISSIYLISLILIKLVIEGFYFNYLDLLTPINTAIFYIIINNILYRKNAKR